MDIEGSGGIDVPYLGYVEARLKINEIQVMDEDSLFLVMPDSNYTKRVSISLDTLHIERCLELSKRKIFAIFSKPWQRALFSKYILKLQKLKELEFNLDKVEGDVRVTKCISLKPFETRHISAMCHAKDHKKRVNVMMEKQNLV